MPILNIFFTKINAERKKELKGKLNVSVNLNFQKAEESEIETKERKILFFYFNFLVLYNKEAKLEFDGYISYSEEKKKVKELLKNWKKDKEFIKQIYNFTLIKCNLKAFLIEEQLGLPLHLPMPRIK